MPTPQYVDDGINRHRGNRRARERDESIKRLPSHRIASHSIASHRAPGSLDESVYYDERASSFIISLEISRGKVCLGDIDPSNVDLSLRDKFLRL